MSKFITLACCKAFKRLILVRILKCNNVLFTPSWQVMPNASFTHMYSCSSHLHHSLVYKYTTPFRTPPLPSYFPSHFSPRHALDKHSLTLHLPSHTHHTLTSTFHPLPLHSPPGNSAPLHSLFFSPGKRWVIRVKEGRNAFAPANSSALISSSGDLLSKNEFSRDCWVEDVH